MIRLGTQGWELHPGPVCRDCTPFPDLRNRSWARLWIQQFVHDPLIVCAIRTLLYAEITGGALVRMSDQQAMDRMADQLSNGMWHAHLSVPVVSTSRGSSQPEVTSQVAAPSPAPRTRIGGPAELVEETGLLPPTSDEEAIALVLKQAAAQGVPFCEECAKAALRRMQEAVHV